MTDEESFRAEKVRAKGPCKLTVRYRQIANLWNAEHSLAEIGHIVGLAPAYVSQAVRLIRQHHPELVTRRKSARCAGAKHGQKAAPSEQLLKAIEMWNTGSSLEEIAQEAEYSNAQSVRSVIYQARQRWPNLYIRPLDYKRGRPTDAANNNRLVASWQLGRSVREIAQEIGLSVPGVYSRVYRLVSEGRIQPRTHEGLLSGGSRQQQLLELWNSGASAAEVAQAVGCSVLTIRYVVTTLKKRGYRVVPRLKGRRAKFFREETNRSKYK